MQYDWCPYEKGKFGDRHAHRKNALENMKAEIRVRHLQAKERRRLTANAQKPGERCGTIVP